MRKMLLVSLILCAVALLSTLWIHAVHATTPIPTEGYFDYTYTITGTKVADGNLFIYATEDEIWVGDLAGTSQAAFRVEIFTEGFWNVWLRSTFTGTVQDKSGTMVIQLVGKRTMWDSERFWWSGQWVIISGTGELENLRGQGTWWGPGFGAVGPDIFYSGQIHFN
jgi:hypothetical protein